MTLPTLYPILDTKALERMRLDPVTTAEAFLEGGARILQFRHKAFWSRHIFGQASEIAELCNGAGAAFIVNDRADYAAIVGAGLHVGQDDLSPEDARRVIGSKAVLGFSTHNPEQMGAAGLKPVNYVAFGPVFPTFSKENSDPLVGLAGLRAVRALTTRPLVAIGGISRSNALTCLEAGADSVAVISDLLSESATKKILRDRMIEWQTLITANR